MSGTLGEAASLFGQVASVICVGITVAYILYEPIIKPICEAIKEFNQNRLSKKNEIEPPPATKTSPTPTPPLRLVK